MIGATLEQVHNCAQITLPIFRSLEVSPNAVTENFVRASLLAPMQVAWSTVVQLARSETTDLEDLRVRSR